MRSGKLSSINQLHRICFLNCCVIGTWLHLELHCKDLPQWWHRSSRATNGLQRLGLARWVSWHTGEIWRSLSSTWILGISLNFEFFEPFWVTFEPSISSQKHFSIVLSINWPLPIIQSLLCVLPLRQENFDWAKWMRRIFPFLTQEVKPLWSSALTEPFMVDPGHKMSQQKCHEMMGRLCDLSCLACDFILSPGAFIVSSGFHFDFPELLKDWLQLVVETLGGTHWCDLRRSLCADWEVPTRWCGLDTLLGVARRLMQKHGNSYIYIFIHI